MQETLFDSEDTSSTGDRYRCNRCLWWYDLPDADLFVPMFCEQCKRYLEEKVVKHGYTNRMAAYVAGC